MKAYRIGTHRTVSPEQTLERIRPFFAAMGITRLANVTGLDEIGIPVVTACRPNAKAVAVSQGKGISLEAAKASAAMEAIETYHAEHIDLSVKYISYQELACSYSVVDVALLPQVDVLPFCPNSRRLWIEGCRLQSGESQYIPYDLVHCDFTLPLPPGSGSFQISTNGLASGNTKDEAISHGLCEVIERDAMALWSLMPKDKQAKQKVDLSSISDPTIQALIKQIEQADVMVSIWNVTSDIGTPTFLCRIINARENQLRPLYSMAGSGTHPDKHVALLRAMTEAVQARLTLISGSRDDISVSKYEARQQLERQRHIRNELMKASGYVDFNTLPSWDNDTLGEDLLLLSSQLEQQNLPSPIVVDLTKPEFNIPVVRVIAPGLEGLHDAPGYILGRRGRNFILSYKELA
ncbi:YcaO-like family protein [Photobacterium sp. OFAV2-7]|uniref:YcaO-like family protein n=1 Tax=Photobacterium sp. OFAV2-7 TaxID=2917748 RepID=UPI001EF5F4DC|nr:YcaO-like family protein [Photobacterium sp. OFAV2-7]MCG7587287.1 YcaO-like family protein [Photobacterium sp. OFAV2-7]